MSDKTIIQTLQSRDGRWTTVILKNREPLKVYDMAWGYDLGENAAHVTSNISPEQPGAEIGFFKTDEVLRLEDSETATVVYATE